MSYIVLFILLNLKDRFLQYFSQVTMHYTQVIQHNHCKTAHVFNYKHHKAQACVQHFIDVPALRWPKATNLGTFLRIVFGAIDWAAAGKGSARVLHIYNIWLNTLTS